MLNLPRSLPPFCVSLVRRKPFYEPVTILKTQDLGLHVTGTLPHQALAATHCAQHIAVVASSLVCDHDNGAARRLLISLDKIADVHCSRTTAAGSTPRTPVYRLSNTSEETEEISLCSDPVCRPRQTTKPGNGMLES